MSSPKNLKFDKLPIKTLMIMVDSIDNLITIQIKMLNLLEFGGTNGDWEYFSKCKDGNDLEYVLSSD